MNTRHPHDSGETPPKDEAELKPQHAGRPEEEPSFMEQLNGDAPEPPTAAEEADPDAPHAKPAGKPLHPHKKADHLAHRLKDKGDKHDRQQALLDEGVEETFPASDPVSVKRIT